MRIAIGLVGALLTSGAALQAQDAAAARVLALEGLDAEAPVHALAWSPDGARLAVAHRTGYAVHEVATGERVLGEDVGHRVYGLSWIADGRLATREPGGIRLRDPADGSVTGALRPPDPPAGGGLRHEPIYLLERPDEAGWVLATFEDVYLLDDAGELVRPLFGYAEADRGKAAIRSVRWGPPGTVVVRAPSHVETDTVVVVDVATGEEVRRLPDTGYATAVSPDGARAVTGRTLFDLASGARLAELELPAPWDDRGLLPLWADYSADGERLVISGSDFVATYDGAGGPLADLVVEGSGAPERLALSPDGDLLAGAVGARVLIFETDTLAPRGGGAGHLGAVTALAFDGSGDELLSGGADGALRRWGVEDGALRAADVARGGVRAIRRARDAETLAVLRGERVRVHRSVALGPPLADLEARGADPQAIALDPAGERLAASSGGVRVVTLDGGARSEALHRVDPPLALSALPGSVHGAGGVFDVATGGRVQPPFADGEAVWRYGADGRVAVVGPDRRGARRGRVVDVRTGATLWALPDLDGDYPGRPRRPVLAFSPDGRLLALGTPRRVLLHATADGRRLAERDYAAAPHVGDVVALAVDPAGRRLAAGHGDGVIRLWALALDDAPGLPGDARALARRVKRTRKALGGLASGVARPVWPGDRLRAAYDFDDTSELADFDPEGDVGPAELRHGVALRAGPGEWARLVHRLPFAGDRLDLRLELTVLSDAAPAEAQVWVHLGPGVALAHGERLGDPEAGPPPAGELGPPALVADGYAEVRLRLRGRTLTLLDAFGDDPLAEVELDAPLETARIGVSAQDVELLVSELEVVGAPAER